MNDKFVLIEYLSNLNDVINQPLQFTQRIKFTCLDVCNKYIIFGATSGGIYIFDRHPCKFFKLIPSKNGAVVQVAVSPDENNIALSTSKGLIVVLEDFHNDIDLQYQVYSEHEGNTVTVMKWLGNEIYCGDNTGKVSVITLTNLLLTKAIFQIPSASLMHLDSSIVQIDAYDRYLLISTQTRSYLCDTKEEQYRQIGKKLRDGRFGGCFFNMPPSTYQQINRQSRGFFKTLKDDETFLHNHENGVKIFVARPGARLWEVSCGADVIFTHQFRDSLDQQPSKILTLDNNPNSHLKFTSCNEDTRVPDSFNFEQIYCVLDKFIFTFKSDSFYIFEPDSVSLAFWSNHFTNIKDIKIVNDCFYIWNSGKMNVVALVSLEHLILKTLYKQQIFCAELCIHYKNDVLDLIIKSNRLQLLSTILKNKLIEMNSEDLVEEMNEIFNKIEDCLNSSRNVVGQKLKSGIVVVDNAHFVENNFYTPDKLVVEEDSKQKCDSSLSVLRKQFELNKINSNIETSSLQDLLNDKDLDSIISLLNNFVQYIVSLNSNDEDDVQKWCYHQYLKHVSNKTLNNIEVESIPFKYTVDSFMCVNNTQQSSCLCSYPTPNAKNNKPFYYNIGCEILNKLHKHQNFTQTVPFMWKHILTTIDNENDILILLPLLIQYNDEDVFSLFLNRFTYDTWDEALKLLIKLQNDEVCLNCNRKLDVSGLMSWNMFGLLILKSVGGACTVKLLRRYSDFIPKGALTNSFYQTCIFSTTADGLDKSIVFSQQMHNNHDTAKKFSASLEKYLHRKHLGKSMGNFNNSSVGYYQHQSVCSYCDLPLNIPVLDLEKVKCGHVFHKLCFDKNNSVCIICK